MLLSHNQTLNNLYPCKIDELRQFYIKRHKTLCAPFAHHETQPPNLAQHINPYLTPTILTLFAALKHTFNEKPFTQQQAGVISSHLAIAINLFLIAPTGTLSLHKQPLYIATNHKNMQLRNCTPRKHQTKSQYEFKPTKREKIKYACIYILCKPYYYFNPTPDIP